MSKTLHPLLSTGSTQEDPSQHDWKIVSWDVKNQNKQTKNRTVKQAIAHLKVSYWDQSMPSIWHVPKKFALFKWQLFQYYWANFTKLHRNFPRWQFAKIAMHKKNSYICWHFNIYQQINTTSKKNLYTILLFMSKWNVMLSSVAWKKFYNLGITFYTVFQCVHLGQNFFVSWFTNTPSVIF